MLNFFSQFYGDLGIPIHARGFGKALKNEINGTKLFQIFENNMSGNYNGLVSDISEMDDESPALIFFYPDVYNKYMFFKKNIGYYIFEYTKIPIKYLVSLNEMDAICTASEWGVSVLKENGVTVPCHIVQGGVDINIFNQDVYDGSGDFTFLHVGKAEERKSTKVVIEAFCKAFKESDDVRLLLSIDNPHIPNFSAEEYIKFYLPINKKIEIIHHVDNITDLYKLADCCVFPTKAEGIGLPIVESMACGIPVIASYNSGTTAYLNDDNAIILRDGNIVPVYDPHFFPAKGEYGDWMEPNVDEVVDKMRWVNNHRVEAMEIGDNGAIWMKENYTWDIAAKQFAKILKEQ